MNQGTNWRILVVEDKELFRKQLLEAIPGFVDAPDTAEADLCEDFNEAIQKLQKDRYDVVILDLKDDSDGWALTDDDPAGLKVFERLKSTRFVPVVFYTALAHKVRPLETSFVRVVEKTETTEKVKEEVRRVLATQLPALTRHLEEVQRSYMWGFVSNHWRDMSTLHHKVDLVYLVARRLAQTLRGDSIRSFVNRISQNSNGKSPVTEPATPCAAVIETDKTAQTSEVVHPVELYIYPSETPSWLAGDILHLEMNGKKDYWLVLTPSCDFENGKAEFVILANCRPLAEQDEYGKWAANKINPSKNTLKGMEAVICDNRGGQKERFKFLPGTFFLPDLVVDFQQLLSVPLVELKREWVVATLDSPFSEAVLARFSRYFGRLGTPNIDKNVVINRLQTVMTGSSPGQAPPSSA